MAKKKDDLKDITFIDVPPMPLREEVVKKFYNTKSPVVLMEVPRIPSLTETDYKALAFDILTKKFDITLGDWNDQIKGIFVSETTENHRARDIETCGEMISDYEEDVFRKAGIE